MDLGDYGGASPASVTISQNPLSSLRSLLLWLPLLLAVLLCRTNWRMSLLWLLIPFALMKLGLIILAKTQGMPSEIADVFEYLSFGPLTIGMATILLLGSRLGHYRGFTRTCLAILCFAFCIGMGIASFGFSGEAVVGLISFAVTSLTVVLAQVASRFCCRRRFAMPKYLLCLALNTLIFISFGLTIYILVAAMQGEFAGDLPEILLQMLIATGSFAAVLFVVQLPFVLLGRYNAFYRERFFALLGIPSNDCLRSQPD